MKTLFLAAAAGLLTAPVSAQLPVSGRPVAGMTAFDTIMTNFMNANGITAGVLGISRNGRIEYLRSFGWLVTPAGGSSGVALPENAMMRTASVVKPVTAAAIRQLSADGTFGATGLNSNAFAGLIVGTTGLMSVTPRPSLGDSRHANVTLNHLILHQGGFDRNTNPPGDVMFQSRAVATSLSVNSPPNNTQTMSYMLGRALQWTPGTVSNLTSPAGADAYSNYGYMVLGEVLERFAPGGYFGYVHSRIMSPDRWIPSTEFALARTFVANRHPREPRYIASNTSAPNVFDNTQPIETVPMPDGGFYIEAMLAHGGTIASAPAMIRFANDYHLWYLNGDIGQRITTANPMQNYAHSGRLDGCNTMLQQRSDGIVFYFALNHGNPNFAGALASQINNRLNAGGFTWPDATSDGFWVNVGAENASAGHGGYHSTYQGLQSAINRVTNGSRLRLKPGSQAWTGSITKRLELDAPEGPVRLGP